MCSISRKKVKIISFNLMGADTSSETNVIISYLSTLLSEDHSGNYQFWYQFLHESPDRFSSMMSGLGPSLLDSKVVLELAIRQPSNFENYILASLKELSEASKSIYGTIKLDPEEETPSNYYDLTDEKRLNAIHFALTTLPTFLSTLLRSNQLLSSLAFLDTELFDEIAKHQPSAAEFEKRKKKLPKTKKMAKNEQTEDTKNHEEEDEEKPNEEQNSEKQTTKATQPKKKKTLSPEKQLAKRARLRYFAMRRQRGSLFSDLANYLSILLFKPELTVLGNKGNSTSLHSWSYVSQNVDQIRSDIAHNLLFLGNIFDMVKIYRLERPINSLMVNFSDGSFPLHQLILSLGNIQSMPKNSFSPKLIHNSLALIVMLFGFKGCKSLFTEIELSNYTRIFFQVNKSKNSNIKLQRFLLDQNDQFSVEWISFLFISLYSQPELLEMIISNEEISKEVIKFLLNVADHRFQKEGISYLHSVILTILLFILETDENHPPPMLRKPNQNKTKSTPSSQQQSNQTNNIQNENNPQQDNENGENDKDHNDENDNKKGDDNNGENDQSPKDKATEKSAQKGNTTKKAKSKAIAEFRSRFVLNYFDDPINPGDIKDTCFADFILSTLMHFCTGPDFLPSFCCVFHLIVPHVQDISLDTAILLFQLYENCTINVQNLFIDAFATLVQIPRLHSSIKTVLFHKWQLFIDPEEHPGKEEQLEIIRTFIKKAKRALIKYGPSTKLGIESAAEVISHMNIQIKKTFPNPKYFLRHPITTGADVEKTWESWSALLCQIAAISEIKSIKKIGQSQ